MFKSTDIRSVPVIYTIRGSEDSYTIDLPSYRDVVSIELIQAIVPIASADHLFFSLQLNNYQRTQGNTTSLNSSFCNILAEKTPVVNQHYTYYRKGGHPDDAFIYYFDEPSRLGKFQVRLVAPDGTNLFSGTPQDFVKDHVLVFEIRSLSQRRF